MANVPSHQPSDPLVKIAVTLAGVGAAFVANQALERVWGLVFDEKAPTEKYAKSAAKEVKQERKAAKKDGASKAELATITSKVDEQPIWKLLLWAALPAGPSA